MIQTFWATTTTKKPKQTNKTQHTNTSPKEKPLNYFKLLNKFLYEQFFKKNAFTQAKPFLDWVWKRSILQLKICLLAFVSS